MRATFRSTRFVYECVKCQVTDHYADCARSSFDTESEVIRGSRVSLRKCSLRRLLRVRGNSNGPVGIVEYDQFGAGTKAVVDEIARSKAFSLASGGDVVAAIEKYGVVKGISCISTGDGAFLKFVEVKHCRR